MPAHLGQCPCVDNQSLKPAELFRWRHALSDDLDELQQHAIQLLHTHHEGVQGTAKGPNRLPNAQGQARGQRIQPRGKLGGAIWSPHRHLRSLTPQTATTR